MRVVILTVVLATVLGVDAKQSARTKRNACTGIPDGTFVADAASCSNFFICYNEEPVVQSCNQGSYFDTTNSYCLPDTQDICPPAQRQCAIDGEFSPHPTECSQFYVCSKGELIKQSCLPGNYFDSTHLYCIPDTNDVCPQPSECSENGTYSPHPTNCLMFYICYNGKLVEQSCNPGSYFNKTTLNCVPDTNNVCPVAQCTEEGEFVPHPTQCDLFYVCYNGLLVEQTCGSGSYFDKTNLYCTPDSENICWPLTPSTEAPCTCVGGYTNGQFIASPDNCYSYYVCSGGELLEQNCGYGNYFDNEKKVCEQDKDGSCWPGADTTSTTTTTAASSCSCPGGYEEGDIVSNADSCHSYFICSQGELTAQSCGAGNYFDTSSKSCARDENGSCWPTTTSTTTTATAPCQCPGGYEEGDLVANSDSCQSYFVCTQGELIAQSCGTGNYFDASTKNCARDENGSCWPTTTSSTTKATAPCQCPGGYEEGDLVANSDSCQSYFVCTQGELIAQSCGTGNYFDKSSKSCARDENGSCWPTTSSTTTTAIAPCQCPGGYEEGDLVANSDNCSSYFICSQGKLIEQDCGSGNYFDQTAINCIHDVNGICRTTCPGGYDDGDLVANSDNCSSYFICSQGKLIEQDCGSGNYFDATAKNCIHDVNGICRTTCPGGYDDGDLVANSDNCSSYFICSQGKLIEQDCGSGNYFDATAKNCIHDVNGICRTTCPGGYDDGDLVANSDNCSSYFICSQGKLIEQDCGSGNYFDATANNCIHDVNGICRTTCPGGYDDGDLVANSDNCSSYFICSQGKLIEQDCGSGNYFDATAKNCIHDVNGICRTTCPGGYDDGDLVANSDNCSSYFICSQGKFIEQDCGSGNYFDATAKNCIHDVNGICRTTCPGGYDDGDLVANSENCSSYFICSQGKLIEQDCGSGNYFDATAKNCIHDVNGICRTTCPGGYDDGDLVANSDNCSSYFICSQGKLIEQDCGSGNYFDATAKNCIHDVNGICSPTKPYTCPGGYEDGELMPYPGSCFKFYTCFNGELVEESCHQGNYFDSISKSCVVDDTGVCWPIISTPSTTSTSKTTKPTPTPSTASTSSITPPSATPSSTKPSTATPSTTKLSSETTSPTTPSSTTDVNCSCAGGYEDGELIPYPGSCFKFYICFNGELVEGSCHQGNYFDSISKSCVVDETGVCWPIISTPSTSSTSKTTKSTPTPSTASTSSITPPSTTPSSTKPSTITPSSESTSPTTPSSTTDVNCSCAGGYEDGELIPYPGNCFKFYICFNGELVEETCHQGNYFDSISKSCVVDETGVCWPIISTPSTTSTSKTTKPTPTPSTASTSSITPPSATPSSTKPSTATPSTTKPSSESTSPTTPSSTTDVNCSCAGGYEDGELIPYPGNCFKFYICFNGELVEESCHQGNYFDSISKSCVVDETGVCWPIISTPSTTSTSKTTKPTPTPSTASTSSITPPSATPSPTKPSTATPSTTKPSSETTSPTTPSSTTDVNCSCAGGYEDGELIPYPGSCFKFYICFNGELVEGSCHQGNYFDSISKSCVVDETGVCWPIISTPSTSSTSKTTKSTPTPSTASTSSITPPSTTPSSTKPSTITPSSESTSPTTPSSTTDVNCSCAGGYEDGDLIPYPGSCFKFYICFNGELVEESCHQGNYFDSISKSCVVDETGVCWPIISTPSTTSTSKTTKPTPTPSTASTSSITPPSATPSSTKPSTATPSTTKPSSETTSPTTPSSTTDVNCSCAGGYEDGELIPYPGSCFKFYICFNGELVEGSCHQGNYFDSISKSCVVDETGVCWPIISTPSATSTSKTTKPTPTPSTASTSSITPPSATPSSTKPSTATPSTTTPSSESTSPTTPSSTTDVNCSCAGGYEDGELIPYPGNCFKFYICFNGELVEESCHQGNYFDSISKSCVVDETGVCWPIISTPSTTSTSETTKPTPTPSTASTSSITPPSATPSSTKPSTATPSTTTPSSESTSPTTESSTTDVNCSCAGGYEDGDLIPYPGSCFKFYICFNGELVEESCHQGNYFDSISKSCVVDDTGVCWPIISTPSTSSTSKTTNSTPTPSTASTSSITPPSATPFSTKPSTATPSTTTPSSESTSPTAPSSTTDVPCSCPGGYDHGEFVPYPGNCYKFYICFNGELLEESCGQGNYFDTVSKSCVRDKTGVCWPINSTPSTTTTYKTTASTTSSSTTASSTTSSTSLSTTPSSKTPSTTSPSKTTSSTTTSSTKPSTATPSTTTPSSESTSPTTPSSTTDVNCSCAGGYEDGELIPYPGNCFKFYICFNGELVEESCHQGNYFDSISKSCVVDETGVCWPIISTPSTTSTSKTTKPTPTPSTASTSSITPPSSTPSSTKPSTATPSTTTPSSESTSPTTESSTTESSTTDVNCSCAGGYEDGDLIPYPGSCFKFYICFNGELVEESCHQGNYFDSISKSCVVDDTGVCWPIISTPSTSSTSKTTNSTPTPSTASTSSITPPSATPFSTKPSTATPSTTTPSSESTSPTAPSSTTDVPCSCPGGYDHGEFIPYPGNCYKFYICFNGELLAESCGKGNYFDSVLKSCFHDKSGECWPIAPSTTIEAKTTTSTATSSSSTPPSTKSSSIVPSTTSPLSTTPSSTIPIPSSKADSTTVSSAAPSTTKTFTTTEAPTTCPGGYGDSEFIPHPESCYLFYVCYQSELVEVSCGFGNYFDTITKSCVLDTTGICWSRTTSTSTTTSTASAPHTCAGGYESGDFVAIPNSCYGFYICYEGELNEMSCGTGNYFDTNTKSCALDTTGICWPEPTSTTTAAPRLCLNGYQNGQIVPNPATCYMYYICIEGDLIEGNCGTGNYFNNATNACDVDRGGCCWPSLGCPNGLQQDQLTANPSSCYLYNICHNGQLLQGNCGTGNYFNSATNACEADSSGKCSQWTPPFQPQPPTYGCNGLHEGQFSSSPSACYLYNICHNGRLLQGNCGTGNYFNSATNACEADSSGKCSQWTPPLQPQPPSYGCNGLQEGQFSSSPSACHLYNICHNGRLLQGNCGTGNYFNSATNACEADSSGKCSQWTPPLQPQPPSYGCNGLQEGQFSSSPSACYLYNICHNGQLLQGNCGTGNYFNSATNACEADSSGKCSQWTPPFQPQPPSYGCNGLQEGQFSSSPSACYLYNICHNGQLLQGNCGTGNYFNSATNACEADSSGKCSQWTPPFQPQPPSYGCNGLQEGQFSSSPSACYLYNICHNGRLLQGNCGNGNYFNSATNACEADSSGKCSQWTPPFQPQPPSYGCNGLQEGQFSSSPSACYLYNICHNGQLLQGNCGTGNYFNSATNACEADSSGKCSQWTPPFQPQPPSYGCNGLQEGQFSSSPSACYLYNICHNGRLLQGNCGNGNYFNSATNTCEADSSGKCSQWTPPFQPQPPSYGCNGLQEGQFSSSPSACYLYNICHNGRLLQGNCGNGNYFNSATNTCEADSSGKCSQWTPPLQPQQPSYGCNGLQEGQFSSSPSACYLYNICHNGRLLQGNCGTGNYFNSATNACEADSSGKCSQWTPPFQPQPPSYGCNGLQEGQFSSSPSACYLYNICHNGRLLQGNCGNGNYFNSATNTCEADSSGKCSQWTPPFQPQPPSYGCNELQEGQFSSSPSACYLYNICHNGRLLQGNCGNGNYFNSATNACEADSSGKCSQWTPPFQPQPPSYGCNGLQEGQFSSSPSACYLYNICHNGRPLQGNCGTGNYFNSATNTCEADSSGKCSQWTPPFQPQPPSYGCNGLQEGQFSSSPSACYLYNICHNGQLLQGNCGTGNYFNSATNTCEADSSGNCWQSQPPSSGCRNGMQEGQFMPNSSSCYLYNICFNGQILQGTCGSGNYFNSATKTCETDISGTCWPLSSPSIPQPPSYGCPNGMQEGQFTVNPSSCYLYNICYNGQLLQGTCGTGNYFNSSTNTCDVDTLGRCWPLHPPLVPEPEPCACPNGLQEGQFTSNPSSCYLYSICQNGELIEGNCGTGNYFNNVTNICETDTGGCCWPSNAECPGGYANGDFVPDPSQCDKFFICYQGALVPQDCGVGYFFDIFNNYCTRDINGTCWAVPTPNNTCDGAADGTFIVNETFCDKYSVCYNNSKIGQECGIGNYFNSETLTCVRDTLGTCWKKVTNVCANATTGTFVANPSNCQEFYVCYQNRAVLQQCSDGNWFNPQLLVCQPDLAAACVNVCRGTNASLILPHPKCNQFYSCVNGLTTGVGTCRRGSNFNETLGICLTTTICEADLCAKSGNGIIYPVQSDLSSFYSCENRIPVKHSCPDGASFDPERLICTPDTGRCIGEKNGFAVASYNNPNAYYVCKNNMAIFAQCPSYAIFDEKRNICVQIDRRRVANNKCAAEPDGTMLPGDACNEYHLCLDGEDIAQNCGAYSSFNKKIGHCTLNLTCFHEADLCAKSSDTESFPDARYENVFYKCKRGLAVKEKCPNNMIYSHDIGYCVPKELAMSSDELDQLCENVPDNTMAPAMDCRKFYICSNNVAILQKCASDQHFGVMTGTCLPDVERQCWIRGETLRGSFFIKTVCHEGRVRAHATDCVRYEICADGIWTAELCPARHLFDAASQVCVPGNGDQMCRSARSAECSDDMPLRASENACTDYYRCEKNHWRAAKCPIGEFFSGKMATCTNDVSACARSEKTKSVSEKHCIANETRADELNCGLFHVCHEGEWWYRYCEEGSYFNRSLAVCTPNDGTCRSVSVPGPCRNGTVKKSDYDPCIVYHLCVDGNWTTQHCPAEHYFDETRKACMLDDGQRKCQSDIKNTSSSCKDGDRRYQSSNCKAFDICSFGNWLSVECRSQFYFDTSLKVCMPNRGECSVNGLLRQECVENTSRPNPGNCSEFYYCSRSKWQLESCLNGFQYNATIDKCIPENSCCQTGNTTGWMQDRCAGLKSGSCVAHESECTKYYLCVDDLAAEAECSAGRFFDNESKYCELNNGACPLKMATDESLCQGTSNDSHVQNPANCTTFYICTDTLPLLSYCPPEQYFNAEIGACQFDTGICNKPRLCDGNSSGRLPHERYCNIYYSCVRGMAIPVACEEDHIFDPTSRNCILDTEHRCIDGVLVGDEICAQGNDGRPLVASDDCTKYVMCTNGLAQTLQCPPGKFFDSNVMKCMPDDGSCPFVDGPDLPNNNTIPPDPITCIGKHGYLMPDPEHCNEWYVCIYGNLRHERCFDGEFFDLNTYSCSPMADDEKCPTAGEMTTMCANTEEATSFADQTDCRKYYQCNDGELQSKKCRNGESFDTLLGFCRQNDGTCLLENGQRVGACAGKHGKLAADSENCRGYFTCINGQKISEECDHGEYFVKATSRCEKDVNNTCRPIKGESTNATQLSCDGLNELVFYPNAIDGCRTFFQCVKGTPRVHKCPDDLLFNGKTGICDWKDYVQCLDISQHHQTDKVCLNAINGTRYGSSEDNCDSYFICNDGKMKTFKCDQGHKYNAHLEKCDLAENVNCTMAA